MKEFIVDFLIARDSFLEAGRKRYEAQEAMWENLKKIRKLFEPREYKLLKLRFIDNLTLEQAGKEFGVTRERIRQIETQAIEKLKQLP